MARHVGTGVGSQPENDLRADWVQSAADRYAPLLLRYATSLLGRSDHAHDVVQDTLAKLCSRNPAELDGRLGEWLFTVCRNRVIDIRRKEGRMISMTEAGLTMDAASVEGASPEAARLNRSAGVAPHAADPAAVLEQRESAGRALSMLASLPENQREVLRLKFQAGMSYKEIAAVTQLSVSNVGFLIHTGLKTLRERMKEL